MRNKRTNLKYKTKFLGILLFTIILPTILSTPLFTDFSGKINNDNTEKDPMEKLSLSNPSSNLPHADYFLYYKIITIDHTKVNGSVDHQDFPVLISIIDADLDDKAQFDGDDIAFANGTAWLDFEIELYNPSYSATEAQLIAWVRVPLLSTSIDTKLFMFYGNSTMSNQENPTGVWDTNYKGVWHLKEDPGIGNPGDIKDSTINSNHGTAIMMGSADQELGQIDGSMGFDGNSDPDYISIGNVGPEIKTIEFWMKATTLGSSNSYNTGYHSPTATGDDYNQWNNPTGGYTNDGNRASEWTNYEDQDWYNFGFTIPSGASIDGIEVSIDASTSVQFESTGCRVRLSWNGGSGYYTNYKTQSWSSTYDSYRTVGGAWDTWGRSWSSSDFSNTNFRVRLEKTGSYSASLRVDHIRVIVYYSIESDTAIMDLDGTDQISIDAISGDIKPISFPGSTAIYVDGIIGSTITTGSWYHVAITDTTGLSVSALNLARNSTEYFNGGIDEFRLSNIVRSADWIATEYNNQKDPSNFYSVGTESNPFTDVQIDAIDLYGNPVPNVNISIYKHNDLIRSDIANENGTVLFENILSIEYSYNFTVSMTSNIEPYNTIIINRTSESILISGTSQIINLICNISRNIFNVVDIDGVPVDSGWVVVGNSSNQIQNCTIDNSGQATFRWLETIPYDYNYTIWYRDSIYNPKKIIVGSGDIVTPNSEVNVSVILTTINFTVLTYEAPFTPIDGVKIILDNLNSGENIVNLTSDLNGNAVLRWLDSSILGINSNYSLRLSFYGQYWDFEIPELLTGRVGNTNFTVTGKAAYTLNIHFAPAELENLETNLISLNPTNTILVEWGLKISLRALFNVTNVPSGSGVPIGPTYADSMSYHIFEGTTLILSNIMPKQNDYIGRHKGEIDTTELESETPYILKLTAQKSGYVLPPEVIMSLYLNENDLILNQSQNDDSTQSIYWEESVEMSVNPYGQITEYSSLEYNIYNIIYETPFRFSIPDISNDWNLSQITFNIYNISWNALPDDINISIALNDYGIFEVFNTGNHNGHDYAQGTWTGIKLNIDKRSPSNDNNFEFTIGGTFDSTIDVIVDAIFIRDKINVQYTRFNITETLSLLNAAEGWVIKNITFELFNCYNTSNWHLINPLSDVNLNISTNEGIKYSLDSGSSGFGKLNIDDRIIYPLDNQFLFTVEANPEIMFDVVIKVEYIQEFYQNYYLETLNISKTERNIAGIFQINANENDWIEDSALLLINEISDGIDYFLPSELSMTITIGGTTYNIVDIVSGQGLFSLQGLNKETIYQAVINTNQPTIFNLQFKIDYSRTNIYETRGSVSYTILENPAIFGTVQYNEDLECYSQLINTTILNTDDYTIRFTILKENYASTIKDLELSVLARLTLLNGTSGFFRKIENIYFGDAVNFTFLYTDSVKGTKITDLTAGYYVWEKYDEEGEIIADGQGTLITNVDQLYTLDFNTENLTIGEYFLIVSIGKKNYEYKTALISLTIKKRIIGYLLNEGNNQINVKKGEIAVLQLELTDPSRGGIPLQNTTVLINIRGTEYEFEVGGPGIYIFNFHTGNIDTFFSPKTFTGRINITKENYVSEEFSVTIVVAMDEIFPGIPTFYFLLILSVALGIAVSIVSYRAYKRAKIPTFVKKVRDMKKTIDGGKSIPDTLLYRDKEAFIGEIINNKWRKLGLSLEEIFGITIEKDKKEQKVKKKISGTIRSQDKKPLGILFMKWDEKIGTEILAKYPEAINITPKSLMQVYSTHEYSGEKGVITLITESLNILSYYTGAEKGYYLVLLLNLDDDPDFYEAGIVEIARVILENLKDESYLRLLPSLFQRLSVYPSLSGEEILIYHYQNGVKRAIINALRDDGIISKSELMIWLKDRYTESFFDIDAILMDLIKMEIIKVGSIKGVPSELIFFINDLFTLRTPPTILLDDPMNRGLPSQFVKEYQEKVRAFFQDYKPTEEDNIKLVDILIDPQVYETLKLLRIAIVTKQDLEKLRKKGVHDINRVLKLLWDNKMIIVFNDKMNNEYYALLTDVYVDFIFPKYLLSAVKTAYEQKSRVKKVLFEYLQILEDAYFELKKSE
ncbi:MAG: hypothetical protein ACFE9S_00225 [Candidatus Hermodarchaeota archaeon]